MCLNEGGTEIIAADLMQIQDEDTDPRFLRIVLSQLPVTGSVRKDNNQLLQGDSFSLDEIENFRSVNVFSLIELHYQY